MKNFDTKLLWQGMMRALPVLLGATAGYAYYHFIGCVSGSCPIASNPWSSTGYGALIGLVLAPWKNKKSEKEKDV